MKRLKVAGSSIVNPSASCSFIGLAIYLDLKNLSEEDKDMIEDEISFVIENIILVFHKFLNL